MGGAHRAAAKNAAISAGANGGMSWPTPVVSQYTTGRLLEHPALRMHAAFGSFVHVLPQPFSSAQNAFDERAPDTGSDGSFASCVIQIAIAPSHVSLNGPGPATTATARTEARRRQASCCVKLPPELKPVANTRARSMQYAFDSSPSIASKKRRSSSPSRSQRGTLPPVPSARVLASACGYTKIAPGTADSTTSQSFIAAGVVFPAP